MLCSTHRQPVLRDPFRNLFETFFTERLSEPLPAEAPRTNIAETDTDYVLSFELPGLEDKDIQVQLHERQLTVQAERADQRATDGTTWHRVEHRYGSMTRSILLPEAARADDVEATYRNGILTVTVPKRKESQPTKVPIKTA